MARIIHRAGLITFLILVSSCTALACIIDQPFDPQIMKSSDTIVRARVVGYELVRGQRIAKLEFTVLQTYKGRHADSQVAYWDNSTFGLPKDFKDFTGRYGKTVIVGLSPYDTSKLPKHDLVAIKTHFPELLRTPRVTQNPCTRPFMGSMQTF